MNKIIKSTRKLGKGEEMQEWGKKMSNNNCDKKSKMQK
jgi:hypothetical protein